MNDLRTAAQQALEALEQSETFVPYEGFGMARKEAERRHQAAITALRAALAQQDEPDLSRCPQCNGPADNGFDRSFPPSPYLCKKCMAEPVQDQRCRAEPRSDGDFVCDCKIGECPGRSTAPPKAEPVEPVAWECKAGGLKPLTQRQYDAQTAATKRHYTRIAPPQHEALQNTKHYEAPPGFVLNPDYLVPELRAQRDALLEALKVAEPYLRHADVDYNVYVQCRAAIALVEGRVKAVEEGK